MIDKRILLEAAEVARKNAYAPYSKFTVGAALLTESGTIYTGCNVENASYGETCCAERTAIFKAVADGHRRFTAMAVVGGKQAEASASACVPCGSCRQVMAEFCNDDCIILSHGLETTLGALLPDAFRLTSPEGGERS